MPRTKEACGPLLRVPLVEEPKYLPPTKREGGGGDGAQGPPTLGACHPKTGGRWEPPPWVERDTEG